MVGLRATVTWEVAASEAKALEEEAMVGMVGKAVMMETVAAARVVQVRVVVVNVEMSARAVMREVTLEMVEAIVTEAAMVEVVVSMAVVEARVVMVRTADTAAAEMATGAA